MRDKMFSERFPGDLVFIARALLKFPVKIVISDAAFDGGRLSPFLVRTSQKSFNLWAVVERR